ncbi:MULTISPECIES: tyrosine-type recombinase/integrase [unclassified Clostridium]|uniref:tyrosine-type recombinase/integrase n=1 Tax=unclassified Clostridium TaxID=2614128 RepID=UPI001DEEB266|nr:MULTISPECIES: tyrosine-type recombinase/integrase [unclassified Clostridium]MBN1045519.1 site-specific integrase [Clostridium botulinum]MBN1052239.1 site-specific integrase [Clostridium botulinum]
MKGTIRKKGNNYYIRYYETINGVKKQVERKGGNTYAEAEKKLNEVIYEQNNGYVNSNMSLKKYLNMWLEDYVKKNYTQRTYEIYTDTVKNYIIPTIGNIKLNNLKVIHIEKFINYLRNTKSINGTTVNLHFRNLNTALNKAIKLQLLNNNPCKYVEIPKKNKFKGNYLTIDEFKKIYNSLSSNTYLQFSLKVLLNIAVETGCRRGEMCGLDWNKDLDLDNNIISFNRALIKTNSGWIIGKLKTESSYRSIPISNFLSNQLKQLKKEQIKNKLLFGEKYNKNIFNDIEYDLVCIQRNGKYMRPIDITDRFHTLLKRNEINKKIRWHDLRHTSATLLLENGVDMKTVQNRLGHASMNTTSNIYSHVTEKMNRDATSILSSSLFSKK